MQGRDNARRQAEFMYDDAEKRAQDCTDNDSTECNLSPPRRDLSGYKNLLHRKLICFFRLLVLMVSEGPKALTQRRILGDARSLYFQSHFLAGEMGKAAGKQVEKCRAMGA